MYGVIPELSDSFLEALWLFFGFRIEKSCKFNLGISEGSEPQLSIEILLDRTGIDFAPVVVL